MEWVDWAYFLFGAALVVIFACIIAYYYRPKRKGHVEEPKFRMLDDD
jgi:cbb3-type cytochrome oxidase subunit 3